MKRNLILAAAALALAAPAQLAAQGAGAVAESTQPHSSVSVLVDPKLSDGRVVVKIAAKNLTAAPVPFGPSSVSIATPDGAVIALYPLQSLINDVQVAAGLSADSMSTTAPTQGAHAAPQMTVREGGQVDVTGYTGGAAIGGDEYRRSRSRTPAGKPTITTQEAEAQIAVLRQAILQDTTVAPGQIIAGQVVTAPLEFGKDQQRLLHVRVRIAGDEHSFTIAAPKA